MILMASRTPTTLEGHKVDWTVNDKTPQLISAWVDFDKLSKENQEYFKGRFNGEEVIFEKEETVVLVTYFSGQNTTLEGLSKNGEKRRIYSEPWSEVIAYSKDCPTISYDPKDRNGRGQITRLPTKREIYQALSPREKLERAKNNPTTLGNVICYGGIEILKDGRESFVWATDDELKLAIDQPFIEPTDAFGFDYRSKNPMKTNPLSERDRMRLMLQKRLKRKAAEQQLKIHNGKKPCRMKACGGVTHAQGEKCPTMAALGKRGGKSGTGASKARKGDKNGRTKRRQCCGSMYRSPHALTCKKAKPTLRKDRIKIETGPIETRDPFAYYQSKINGGA